MGLGFGHDPDVPGAPTPKKKRRLAPLWVRRQMQEQADDLQALNSFIAEQEHAQVLQTTFTPRQQAILDELRKRVARSVGISLVGNRLTLRYNHEQHGLVEVHSVILSVL